MIKDVGELIDGVRAERIAHFRSIKSDAGDVPIPREVIRRVGQVVETGHDCPIFGVEEFADDLCHVFRL